MTGDRAKVASIAYLLLVHKDSDQLRRLMRAIAHPRQCYAIHVDKSAPLEVHRAAAHIAREQDQAWVLRSIDCRHAGFSLVAAQQRGIRFLLKQNRDWTHLINLSGEDYPLLSQEAIARALAEAEGTSFLQIFDPWETSYWPDADLRFDGVFWEPAGHKCAERLGSFRFPRRWILGKKLYGGSQWMILSRPFCEYVTKLRHTWRANLFFRHTYVPDESYYHTLYMSSPFRDALVNDNRRFIDWVSGPERPRILRFEDLPRLKRSGAFFARKLNAREDARLVDLLEAAATRASPNA